MLYLCINATSIYLDMERDYFKLCMQLHYSITWEDLRFQVMGIDIVLLFFSPLCPPSSTELFISCLCVRPHVRPQHLFSWLVVSQKSSEHLSSWHWSDRPPSYHKIGRWSPVLSSDDCCGASLITWNKMAGPGRPNHSTLQHHLSSGSSFTFDGYDDYTVEGLTSVLRFR